jgi:hypothetical protein
MIPRLMATQFSRFMESGRTRPALCSCEDQSGAAMGEYVVKLRAGLETGESGLLRELIAARLARHFGIASPEPALIMIGQPLAELVASAYPADAARIRDSVGLNFGTKVLHGVSTWPVDKSVPVAMLQAAVHVFAFDALIENPDRRYSNPNLLTKGDELFAYDHEMAFSFLLDLLPSAEPWKLEGQRTWSTTFFIGS